MPLRDKPALRSAVPAETGIAEGEMRQRATDKARSHAGADLPQAGDGSPKRSTSHAPDNSARKPFTDASSKPGDISARHSRDLKDADEHTAPRKRRRRPRRHKGETPQATAEVMAGTQDNNPTDTQPSGDKPHRRRRRGGRGRKRGHADRAVSMAASDLGAPAGLEPSATGQSQHRQAAHEAAGKVGSHPQQKRRQGAAQHLGAPASGKAASGKPVPPKTAPNKSARGQAELAKKSEHTKLGQGHKPTSKAKAQLGAPTYVQRRSNERAIFSAIDLGTNNCRLLIARPTQYGFRVVDAFSRIVRLGEGLGRDGSLCDAAIERAVDALKICADKIDRRSVTGMRHVATQACRIAANTTQFINTIKAETGLEIEVISPAEEARLAVMGCQSLISRSNKYALVFDIGGGSTELIWVKMRQNRQAEIHSWMSIPWGVVNLSEHYGAGTDTDPAVYTQMVDEVIGHLAAFEEIEGINRLASRHRVQFLGTSGTVTTLASLHLKLPRYMRDKVDGAWMKSHEIRSLSRSVAAMSIEERASQPCIGSERADLVVAGCAILDAILSTWSVPGLRVADRGIREGILRGLMGVDPEPLLVGSAASGLSSILPLHDKSAIMPSAQTAAQVTCSYPASHESC